MGIRDRHDRPASHAQELMRRLDHLVAAFEATAQQLVADAPVSGVHLVVFVNASGVETQLHIAEPPLTYPATSAVRITSA